MANRKAPYSHSDGSNCWTVDCSRRGGKTKHVETELERLHAVAIDNRNAEIQRLQNKLEKHEYDDISYSKKKYYLETEAYENFRLSEELQKIDTHRIDETYAYYAKKMELREQKAEFEEAALTEQLSSMKALKYDLKGADAAVLHASLIEARNIAFARLPDSPWKDKYQRVILENLSNLTLPSYADSVEYRQDKVVSCIEEYMEVLESVRAYSYEPRSMLTEFKLGNRIKNVNQGIGNALKQLKTNESEWLYHRRLLRQNPGPAELRFKGLNKAFAPAFNITAPKTSSKPAAIAPKPSSQRQWIRSNFPELNDEYAKTEQLLETAKSMQQGIEDEYFLEQVTADYYPSIYKSLNNANVAQASPQHKKIVVSETKEQLRIIQDGLHAIIDRGFTRGLKETQAQTEFLRSKMRGASPLLKLPEDVSVKK